MYNLNDYVVRKNKKIQDKREELQSLITNLQVKNEQIKLQEDLYTQDFDDKIFLNIKTLKREATVIKSDIETIKDIINLMEAANVTFSYDNEVLKKEIEDRLKELNFPILRNNIKKAKDRYLEAIEKYSTVLEQLSQAKDTIKQAKDKISKENQATIVKALNESKNSPDCLYWNPDELGFNDIILKNKGRRAHSYALSIYSNL